MTPDVLPGHGWDPTAWIALAALGFSCLTSAVGAAFMFGKHSTRISALEAKARDTDSTLEKVHDQLGNGRAQTAGLDATLKALDKTVSAGFDRLERGIRDAIEQARGRRRPASAD